MSAPAVVRDVMTPLPVCCTPEASIGAVTRMMVECDCGAIPVVDGPAGLRPVGMVTDRDIVLRAVARGRAPLDLTAADCMSSPVLAVSASAELDECCRLMEDNQVRRLPVVDESGRCCGIVAQADLAGRSAGRAARLVRRVSKPSFTGLGIAGC